MIVWHLNRTLSRGLFLIIVLMSAVCLNIVGAEPSAPSKEAINHLLTFPQQVISEDVLQAISVSTSNCIFSVNNWGDRTPMVKISTEIGEIRLRSEEEYFVLYFRSKYPLFDNQDDPSAILEKVSNVLLKRSLWAGKRAEAAMKSPQAEAKSDAIFCRYHWQDSSSLFDDILKVYVLVQRDFSVVVIEKSFPRSAHHGFTYEGIEALGEGLAVYSVPGIMVDSCIPLSLHNGCIWPLMDKNNIINLGVFELKK